MCYFYVPCTRPHSLGGLNAQLDNSQGPQFKQEIYFFIRVLHLSLHCSLGVGFDPPNYNIYLQCVYIYILKQAPPAFPLNTIQDLTVKCSQCISEDQRAWE
ncbi:hypothetical protein KIL84_017272 [Mauremys mutica]|uniref:Uncharacterized protein n=1 Tax=Mauremys mutica TaxID=74926 RepID=A0A9D3X5Y2_9SAUR|nr:hypothetical protein KIL84_017272 [Mauremys mutica]